jgi:NADH-quinone oxidoreductase subunit A
MNNILLSPPLAFLIFLVCAFLLAWLLAKLAWRNSGQTEGTGKPYACGEDITNHLAQPDYSQFFPYAFFFTIAHVATLIVTTVPLETSRTLAICLIYIAAVIIGLTVLLRE